MALGKSNKSADTDTKSLPVTTKMATNHKLKVIVIALQVNFVVASLLTTTTAQKNSQAHFRHESTSQNPNEDKVEILLPKDNLNSSDQLSSRYYSGGVNSPYVGQGPRQTQNNPYFVPSYGHGHYGNVYGGGAYSYGQSYNGPPSPQFSTLGYPPPLPPHYLQSNHPPFFGNKGIQNLYSPQIPPLGQFTNSLLPQKPQFPFNPSPPIDPSLADRYYPPYLGGNSPGREPYPLQHPTYGGDGNFGAFLELGLPRQVRVPGRIEISVAGNIASITCEFPRYLILMQKIYWHHKYDDPYGSYYDESNGFGPRINVASPDPWKSVLEIRDFNEDDYGPYRCISAAVLPDEGSSIAPHHRNLLRNDRLTSTTEASTNTNRIYTEHPYEFDSEETTTKKTKLGKQHKNRKYTNTRKIRFERSTKIRKTAEPKTTPSSFSRDDSLDHSSDESNLIASPEVYDPFTRSRLPVGAGQYNFDDEQYSHPKPFAGNINPGPVNSNYFDPHPGSTLSPYSIPHSHQQHNYPYNNNNIRHNISPYHYNSGKYSSYPYGLNAPFYKPKYSIFTVYQDISFAPVDYKPSSTSANPVGK